MKGKLSCKHGFLVSYGYNRWDERSDQIATRLYIRGLKFEDAGDGNENVKKAIGFNNQNNNFARASCLFRNISLSSLQDCDVKTPNFTEF